MTLTEAPDGRYYASEPGVPTTLVDTDEGDRLLASGAATLKVRTVRKGAGITWNQSLATRGSF